MKSIKAEAAQALFPLLSAFHEVNGLPLKAVRESLQDGALVGIVLDFDSKALAVRANSEDDTADISVEGASDQGVRSGEDVSHTSPWSNLIGQDFGWGWVTINQQGYLDGLLLSFGNIVPKLIVTVVASSLKVSRIDTDFAE